MALTIWTNQNQVRVVQLSDAPEDGTAEEQIAHLGTLDAYAGWTCVAHDYTGHFPDTDAALWRWENGGVVTAPAPAPTVVSMRQARLALLQNGLLSQVDTAIAGMPSPQREAAQVEWDYATTVERGSPMTQTLAQLLNLTEAQMDDLFTLAATL